MKLEQKIVAILFITLIAPVVNAQNFLWSKKGGSYSYDYARGISADNSGNFYLTGEFEGTANIGGIYLSTAGIHDIFVAKFNSSGTAIWAKKAGSSSGDVGHAISHDASGNVYSTGEFERTTSFSGTSITSSGHNDVFITKYNSSGTLQWVKKGGSGVSDKGLGIANFGGNVYVTGFVEGSAKFGAISLSHSGGKDAFLAKYDAAGNVVWVKKMAGSGSDAGQAVATDPSGNIYVTGYFSGTANFAGVSLTSSGSADMFIAKFSPAGALLWVKKAGGSYSDYGRGIVADAAGRIFVTGDYRASSNFSGTTLSASGDGDVFIACYNSSGGLTWIKKAGGSSRDQGNAISIDKSSNIFITGYYGNNATFGTTVLSGSDKFEVFMASYTASGAFRWAKKGGGYSDAFDDKAEPEAGYGIAADGSGNVYCAGSFLSNIVFGSVTLSKYNHNDIFITKIGPSGARESSGELNAYISPDGPASFCQGQSLELEANSDSGYIYQWKKDGMLIPGATSSNYIATTNGEYQVRIIHGSHLAWSSPIKVSLINCYSSHEYLEEPDSLQDAFQASLLKNIYTSDSTKVEVYPNPNTGMFTLSICINNVAEKVKIDIINSVGQLIYSKAPELIQGCVKQTVELDGSLPSGMYTMQVTTGTKIENTRIILAK